MAFAIATAVIFVIMAVNAVGATWCHQSGYAFTDPKPGCPSLLDTKLSLYKACGMNPIQVTDPSKIPAQISSATSLYYYQVACGSGNCDFQLMQVVKDQATWTKYDTCEHAQDAYVKTFGGKGVDACKSDATCPAPWCHLSGYSFASAPDCPSKLDDKKALWKACGLNAMSVADPTEIPDVVGDKDLYYYQVSCNGSCAANSWQIMQAVKDQATWNTYDACEHAQALYGSTFGGLGASNCKSDQTCAF